MKPVRPPIVIALTLAAALVLVGAPSRARADEAGDARAFLASLPQLAAAAGKAVTRVGPGAYRVELGAGATTLLLIKGSSGWAAAVRLGDGPLATALPGPVLGDATVSVAFLVVAGAAGTFDPRPLRAELPHADELGRVEYGAGVTLHTQISPGSSGALGQLATAGLLPSSALWVTGSIGGGLVENALGGQAPSAAALDVSLTLAVPAMVPAPFLLVPSPRLTLGPSRYTIARRGGAFTLSGEQTDSTLALDGYTFKIPRTRITFTARGGSYEIEVEGSSAAGQPWRDAFGLRGVELQQVSVRGRVASTQAGARRPPIRGFGVGLGATVKIDKRTYQGEFALAIENNVVEEVSLALTGELGLGFLPGGKDFTLENFAIAFAPAARQAALAGQLRWRTLRGRAAVILSNEPMLLLGLEGLDLRKLVGDAPGLPKLPAMNLLLTAGFAGKTGEVRSLPRVAQALVDEFTGATGGKVTLASGLGIVTRLDAKALGADRFGVGGPVLLAGSLDVTRGSFRLAASLPSLPAIPGLPRSFGVEAPELFVALDQKGGVPSASFGLAMRLRLPIDRQPLVVRGSLAVSTSGTLAFTGALETDWVNPIGLSGLTIRAPVVVSVAIGADLSVDLGASGGVSIAGQTYDPMALCLGLQAAGPVPVPRALAVTFKGSALGAKVQLEILEALVKSALNGPLKEAAFDAATRKALAAVRPSADKISELGDGLGLSALSFKDVDVALTTPGARCDLPAIDGVGVKLAGTALLQGKVLGTLDTYANLTQGFKLASKIADLDLLGLVKLSDLSIDILAPMPGVAPAPSPEAQAEAGALRQRLAASKKALARTNRALKKEKDADDKAELRSEKADLEDEIEELEKDLARATGPDPGHFYLSGRAALLGASGGVRVSLDKTGAEFEFQAALADLGSLALEAATEGPSLTKATDFEIRLGAGNDLDGKMLAKLGAALRASAAARKAAADAVVGGTAQAIKDAEAAFAREDAKAGRDFRAANKALKKAKRKFAKAGRDLRKAKKKCKKDLGDAAFLCDTLDAARDAVKASRASLTGAKAALREIEKSASYARLQAAKATLATLRGSKSLVEAGLAGWAAVDRVGQLVLEGGNSGLVTIEEVVLDASLRAGRGSLAVTVGVGDDELEDSFELALGPGGVLDLAPLADKLADEITAEAVKKDSPVWKALRAAKANPR